MTSLPTAIGRMTHRIIHFFREQAARETQAHLNRQLVAHHRPWGIMRPAHIGSPGSPAWAAAGSMEHEDPLEALWRLPARRPRRAA